jgi:hypothetical protein
MIFLWNKKANNFSKNHAQIISLLEQGEIETIEQLLYQPDNKRIEYLPITFEMIVKFKKPQNCGQSLSVYQTFDKGKYQLVIFEIPWLDKELKYSPIIFDKMKSKIVGIMLPFNELYGCFSKKDNSDISKLGVEWTGFIISKQFGI